MNPLRQQIEVEIRERGPIPFSRYMELCLYHPELGYYSRNAQQFGKAGDFYTSSDVHAVFGRLLARQFDEMWRVLGSPARIDMVELGPGRGLFAQDVLDWSEKKFPDFFRAVRYVLIESSPALRERMKVTLAHHIESGKARFATIDPLEIGEAQAKDEAQARVAEVQAAERRKNAAHGVSRGSAANNEQAPEGRKKTPSSNAPTIVFANEFFDALPVEILGTKGSLRIDTHDGRFAETWAPSSPDELEFLDRYSIHPDPDERVEVPLAAQQYMDRLAAGIQRGFLVAIDYGYTREEQLAGRHRDTVKAIRQHSISANPYEAPGEQDITADVNFTALASRRRKTRHAGP